MNYYIEKYDMEIILNALRLMGENMRVQEAFGIRNIFVYNTEDVYRLIKSFDNSGAEA